MHKKTEEMLNKIQKILIESEHITAEELGKKCHVNVGSIFRVIKFLRLKGIGILTTRKGYILAEFAKQEDDVNFIRLIYGRRTSDFLAIQSAMPHIKERWKSEVDQKNLQSLIVPLSRDISKGQKILLSYKNSYEWGLLCLGY